MKKKKHDSQEKQVDQLKPIRILEWGEKIFFGDPNF